VLHLNMVDNSNTPAGAGLYPFSRCFRVPDRRSRVQAAYHNQFRLPTERSIPEILTLRWHQATPLAAGMTGDREPSNSGVSAPPPSPASAADSAGAAVARPSQSGARVPGGATRVAARSDDSAGEVLMSACVPVRAHITAHSFEYDTGNRTEH